MKNNNTMALPNALTNPFVGYRNSDIGTTSDVGGFLRNKMNSNICFIEDSTGGDDDTGGSDDKPSDIDFNDPRISDYIAEQVSSKTTGLKKKNTELLGKLSTTSERLKGFGNMDPDQISQIVGILQNNEEAQLISEGKIDEVISKRMDKAKATWDDSETTYKSTIDELSTGRNKYKSLYESKIIDDSIRGAAMKAGVSTEAIGDVLMRAKNEFKLGEDGTLEARDESGQLKKDENGRLVTPERYIESMRTTSPHYWPTSQGTDADGQRTRGGSKTSDLEKISDVATSSNFDLASYRKARNSKRGKLGV